MRTRVRESTYTGEGHPGFWVAASGVTLAAILTGSALVTKIPQDGTEGEPIRRFESLSPIVQEMAHCATRYATSAAEVSPTPEIAEAVIDGVAIYGYINDCLEDMSFTPSQDDVMLANSMAFEALHPEG